MNNTNAEKLLAAYLKDADDEQVLEFVDKLMEERPGLKDILQKALAELRSKPQA